MKYIDYWKTININSRFNYVVVLLCFKIHINSRNSNVIPIKWSKHSLKYEQLILKYHIGKYIGRNPGNLNCIMYNTDRSWIHWKFSFFKSWIIFYRRISFQIIIYGWTLTCQGRASFIGHVVIKRRAILPG